MENKKFKIFNNTIEEFIFINVQYDFLNYDDIVVNSDFSLFLATLPKEISENFNFSFLPTSPKVITFKILIFYISSILDAFNNFGNKDLLIKNKDFLNSHIRPLKQILYRLKSGYYLLWLVVTNNLKDYYKYLGKCHETNLGFDRDTKNHLYNSILMNNTSIKSNYIHYEVLIEKVKHIQGGLK